VPKYESGRVISSNLKEHPAVRAWRALGSAHLEPRIVHVLKERRKHSVGKPAVYRLSGVGSGGLDVVAKRCKMGTALVERTIYEQVLPYVPVPRLHYYGSLEEPGGGVCWLFLEDAMGHPYSAHASEHRQAAGRWLGRLHTMAECIDTTATLPDRSPDHYLHHLRSAWGTIHDGLSALTLRADDKDVLMGILSSYEQLEQNWSLLEVLCRSLPRTLVHGDFVGKNIRIQRDSRGLSVQIFDWESAGWGIPVVDLAQAQPGTGRIAANPEIQAYVAVVQGQWPALDLATVERLAHIGTIFRLLAAIGWAVTGLRSGSVRRVLDHLAVYESYLTCMVGTVKWSA
jgi:aminoglycoside phosphotransferase (APT) family kinase protein